MNFSIIAVSLPESTSIRDDGVLSREFLRDLAHIPLQRRRDLSAKRGAGF